MTKQWQLFLDDIRFPPKKGEWIIARTMDDAIWYVETYGLPKYISFDHDLAVEHYIGSTREKSGYDFAKWLINHIMDNKLSLPKDFAYYVHSMNPVGKANIEHLMQNFIQNYP